MAKNVLAHAQDIKAKGAKYCDCPACKAAADILAKKRTNALIIKNGD